MATTKIEFDPQLCHVLGFRHGPRLTPPPKGNVWDFTMDVSPEDAVVGARTVSTYFPHIVPAAMRCSPLPRTHTTLCNRWSDLFDQIGVDARLGILRSDIPRWNKIDAMPDAYNAIPQDYLAIDCDLMLEAGRNWLAANKSLAMIIGRGKVAVTCSHFGNADTGVYLARRNMGVMDNDGWLPGKGFQSGAFVHLSYTKDGWLVYCRYYPVPPA